MQGGHLWMHFEMLSNRPVFILHCVLDFPSVVSVYAYTIELALTCSKPSVLCDVICRSCFKSLLQRLGFLGWHHSSTILWLFSCECTMYATCERHHDNSTITSYVQFLDVQLSSVSVTSVWGAIHAYFSGNNTFSVYFCTIQNFTQI